MSYALKNRSLLSLDELSARDVGLLLDLARSLKRDKAEGHDQQRLRGLHIAALVAADAAEPDDPLETAASEEGAMVVRIGAREARLSATQEEHGLPGLLGRLYDAIEVRGMTPTRLREFAGQCSVPVYRQVSHATNPTRVVADLMTMQEQAGKPLADIALAWLGDPRGERAATLLHGALLMGLDIRVAAPPEMWPSEATRERMQGLAQTHAAHLRFQPSASAALAGCDFCYCDRQALPLRSARAEPTLRGVRGTSTFASGHDADGVDAIDTMHHSQNENRHHAIKALLVATLA